MCWCVWGQYLLEALCSPNEQVIHAMLKGVPMPQLKACASFADVIKAIIPYSDRHFEVRFCGFFALSG